MTGAGGLETFFGGGALSAIGDPMLIGLMIIAFFVGFTLLQGTRLDAKIVIIVPALLLAAAFIPFLAVFVGLFVGLLGYLAVTRFMNK